MFLITRKEATALFIELNSVKIPKFYLLYISTSVWVLGTPNAGRNSHFQHKAEKTQKNDKLGVKFSIQTFFWASTQTLVDSFIPRKNTFRTVSEVKPLQICYLLHFFSFLAQKMLKMTIQYTTFAEP